MIRALNFTDFLKLHRLQHAEVGLNLPNALIVPHSPLTAALTRSLPVQSLGSRVYLYEERGKPGVFVQTRARTNKEEWEVLAVGTIGNAPSFSNAIHATLKAISEPPLAVEEKAETTEADEQAEIAARAQARDAIHGMWSDTLEYVVQDAGGHGVHRIFAKLAIDTPEVELFHRVGFYAYTREHIFSREHASDLGWTERDMATLTDGGYIIHEQHTANTIGILRLYDSVTPPNVRHAEAYTSRSWRIGSQMLPRGVKERAWVMEHKASGRITGYIRILSHRNRHLIRVMTAREQDQKLDQLIRYGLHHLKPASNTQIFASVRDYQLEQAVPLENLGFIDLGEQLALVKHTVQHVRAVEKAFSPIYTYAAKARIEPGQLGSVNAASTIETPRWDSTKRTLNPSTESPHTMTAGSTDASVFLHAEEVEKIPCGLTSLGTNDVDSTYNICQTTQNNPTADLPTSEMTPSTRMSQQVRRRIHEFARTASALHPVS